MKQLPSIKSITCLAQGALCFLLSMQHIWASEAIKPDLNNIPSMPLFSFIRQLNGPPAPKEPQPNMPQPEDLSHTPLHKTMDSNTVSLTHIASTSASGGNQCQTGSPSYQARIPKQHLITPISITKLQNHVHAAPYNNKAMGSYVSKKRLKKNALHPMLMKKIIK